MVHDRHYQESSKQKNDDTTRLVENEHDDQKIFKIQSEMAGRLCGLLSMYVFVHGCVRLEHVG